MKLRVLLAALALLMPAQAFAQGTVSQSGPATASHLAMYIGNGRVVDAGGPARANQPPQNMANPGTLPSGLGLVNNNLGFAVFSNPSNAAHSEFLWGMDYLGTGDGLIKLDRVGGGADLHLYCEINHIRRECFGTGPAGPAGATGATGPAGSGGICASNGIAGQVCNATGGSGSEWGQRVIGAPGPTSGDPGSVVTITGGAGNTSGAGGDVNVTSGAGGASGNPGSIAIQGAAAGSGAGVSGGTISATTGNGDGGGNGGDLTMTTGNSGDSGSRGGLFSLTTGDGTVNGGGMTFTAGSGASNAGGGFSFAAGAGGGTGGSFFVTAGNSATGGSGGRIALTAGSAAGSGNRVGGSFSATTGDGIDTGSGGAITLGTGAGGNNGSAVAGAVTIASGTRPSSATKDSGSIIIAAGGGYAGSNTDGLSGFVYLGTGSDTILGQSGQVHIQSDPSALNAPAGYSSTSGGIYLDGPLFTGNGSNVSGPTISSCGTSPVLFQGDATAGVIVVGGGTVTSCTLNLPFTFNLGAATGPVCMVTPETNIMAWISGRAGGGPSSTDRVTISFASNFAGQKVDYYCVHTQ